MSDESPAATQIKPLRDEPTYSWSINKEEYHGSFETRDDAALDAIDNADADYFDGDIVTIWTARNVPYEPNPYTLAEVIIEHISENAYDDVGEYASNWAAGITMEQKKALGNLIIQALEQIVPIEFFSVDDIEKSSGKK